MKIVILASGSKGNCTYIETREAKVILDAGITLKQVKVRLHNQGIALDNIDAVFVTHEHSDHIKGLSQLLDYTDAPLYINKTTYENANRRLHGDLDYFVKAIIKPDKLYKIKDLAIVPLKLSHDTDSCYGYLFRQLNTSKNVSYGHITDTGYIPDKYYPILSSINTLTIESNHDVGMLQASSRPQFLISRILSDHGHLSNEQCTEAIKKFISDKNKHFILAHVSEECNTYELPRETLLNAFDEPTFKVDVALQNEELPLIEIEDNDD